MLRKALLSVVLCSVAAFSNASECVSSLNAQAPITVVGSFSNMRYTEEHAYGYTVELWRAADCLFGFFLSSDSLAGDTPTGLIEKIKYDEKTGAISFAARLTMGAVPSSAISSSSYVPSKDIYEFTGILKKNSLRGVVLHELTNFPTVKNTPAARFRPAEKVVLKLSPENSKEMQYLLTYSQWELQARRILKHRGPKW